MTKPLRLVVLNEDAEAAKRLADSLSTDDVVVYRIADPDEACQLISLLQHDILLIDIEKLICTPVYPLQAFREAKPDLKIVGISSSQHGDTGLLMELLGLDAYVRHPVTPEALITSLPEIADHYLMAPLKNKPDHDRDDHNRQKLRMKPIPFIS
jgi:two-component SAPR family response regulator